MLFSHPEIKVFYITTLESQLLSLLPKYWFLFASHLCFLRGLINILTTSLTKTISLYILCLAGWKHSSKKQLCRHDDNKPSVARMAGKEVALSKQYFPKKSWVVCQAVMCLNNYSRYSFFIWSLKYNFLMWNTLMIYGSICFFHERSFILLRELKGMLHPSMPGWGARPHQPHTCFMVWFCNSCHMNCLKRDDRHIRN